MTTRRLAISTLVIISLASAGCRDREISAYKAPKETPPALPAQAPASAPTGQMPADHPPIGGSAAPAATSDMANTPMPTASGTALAWTAPANWTPKALGTMRKGSYSIKGDGADADLSIIALPGATGGLEANLNRWRGQVGLTPLSERDVLAAVEKFEANGLQFTVVDYAGNGSRLIGAIVPYQGNSWFFKLMGADALVAGQKPAFLEFLRSVKENK